MWSLLDAYRHPQPATVLFKTRLWSSFQHLMVICGSSVTWRSRGRKQKRPANHLTVYASFSSVRIEIAGLHRDKPLEYHFKFRFWFQVLAGLLDPAGPLASAPQLAHFQIQEQYAEVPGACAVLVTGVQG